MKALFTHLQTRILAEVPAIKTVRMFNSQPENANGTKKVEKPFKYPACFVEFVVNESYNRCMGIIDHLMTIRFRFAVEGYKYERLETFDFCDDFRLAMQLHSPTQAQQESTGVIFTTLQEVETAFDTDFDNVEQPFIGYRTLFRSLAAYRTRTTAPVVEFPINVGTADSLVGLLPANLDYQL